MNRNLVNYCYLNLHISSVVKLDIFPLRQIISKLSNSTITDSFSEIKAYMFILNGFDNHTKLEIT